MAKIWRIVALALHLASVGGVWCRAQDTPLQAEAKARFLATAPAFVEWPAKAFANPHESLQICVHGTFSFGTSLAAFARTATVSGHHLAVKWARDERDLAGCQVIFVGRSAAKRYEKLLEALKEGNNLTIGEDDAFLKAGGMVSLLVVQDGVEFDVNLDAVNAGHMRLSSQLLTLARHVTRRTEVARN